MHKLAAFFVVFCIAAATGNPLGPLLFRTKGEAVPPLRSSPRNDTDPVQRCGSAGHLLQVRISDCDTRPCRVPNGGSLSYEADWTPSSFAVSTTFRMEVCLSAGFCLQILEVVLPNSSVQPEFAYTLRNTIPNFNHYETLTFRSSLFDTDSERLEVCFSIDILYL